MKNRVAHILLPTLLILFAPYAGLLAVGLEKFHDPINDEINSEANPKQFHHVENVSPIFILEGCEENLDIPCRMDYVEKGNFDTQLGAKEENRKIDTTKEPYVYFDYLESKLMAGEYFWPYRKYDKMSDHPQEGESVLEFERKAELGSSFDKTSKVLDNTELVMLFANEHGIPDVAAGPKFVDAIPFNFSSDFKRVSDLEHQVLNAQVGFGLIKRLNGPELDAFDASNKFIINQTKLNNNVADLNILGHPIVFSQHGTHALSIIRDLATLVAKYDLPTTRILYAEGLAEVQTAIQGHFGRALRRQYHLEEFGKLLHVNNGANIKKIFADGDVAVKSRPHKDSEGTLVDFIQMPTELKDGEGNRSGGNFYSGWAIATMLNDQGKKVELKSYKDNRFPVIDFGEFTQREFPTILTEKEVQDGATVMVHSQFVKPNI